MKIKATCPYCGVEVYMQAAQDDSATWEVLNCDPDQEGCDKNFAVRYHWVAVVEVFKVEKP